MIIDKSLKKYSIDKLLDRPTFGDASKILERNNINNLYQFLEHSPSETASILRFRMKAWFELMHILYTKSIYYPTDNSTAWTPIIKDSSPLLWILISNRLLNLDDLIPTLVKNNIYTPYDITFLPRDTLINIKDIGETGYARIAEAMSKLGWGINVFGRWSMFKIKPLNLLASYDIHKDRKAMNELCTKAKIPGIIYLY